VSIRVIQDVWERELEHREQSVLLVFADHANDDGSGARPGLPRVAWKTNYSLRQVKRIVGDLRDRGVLEVEKPGGGRRATTYRLRLDRVPAKTPFDEWRDAAEEPRPAQRAARAPRNPAETPSEAPDPQAVDAARRGDMVTPLQGALGGHDVTPGVTQLCHGRGDTAVSPDPSLIRPGSSPSRARTRDAGDQAAPLGGQEEGEGAAARQDDAAVVVADVAGRLCVELDGCDDVAIARLRRAVRRLLTAGWDTAVLVRRLADRELATADDPAVVLLVRARGLLRGDVAAGNDAADRARAEAAAAAEHAQAAAVDAAIDALPGPARKQLLAAARARLPPFVAQRDPPDDHPAVRALARDEYRDRAASSSGG
jgi:hypothetical protein